MIKLAIVNTHPIQYYAPVFKMLAETRCLKVKVFYTWGEASISKFDPGFGKRIEWDIPVLEGYDYEFLINTSKRPGSHHFKGIVNPSAIERIEVFKPDVLLVYGWSYQSHLKVLRHFKNKIPVYFRGDSTLIDDLPGVKCFLRSIFLKILYRYVDFAFYVGTANKKYYIKAGLKQNQLLFAPHAVDNKRFGEDRKLEATELRAKLGIGAGETVILFAGKMEAKKGPDLLLDSFLKLNKAEHHLLFTGNGNQEARLKKMAIKRRNIHFMEFQNQAFLPAVYHACDLFCLPSRAPGETWGLAVNEAMAAGKAILVSDKVGSGADLVKEGVNGSIFESENVDDLSTKLRLLLKDKKRLLEMGVKSSEIIRNWTFEKQVDAISVAMSKIKGH